MGVGDYPIAPFTSPVGMDRAAYETRGNDNVLRDKFVAHQADVVAHVQSGLASARPAAGTVTGETYIATDTGQVSIWSGTAWSTSYGVVLDGDKGDITVSSSGTVWTIDNGVVTTAKMGGDVTTAGKALLDDASAADQRTTLGLGALATASSVDLATQVTGDLPLSNLAQSSAASRLLGRGSAAGAGDFQEILLGTNLSMSGTTLNATGGGSDPWTYKTLPSDYTTTSATLATVTATGVSMDFSPAANTNYEFEAKLMLRTSVATNNPRTAVAWPTGMTDGVVQIQQTGATATTLVYTSGSIVATVQVAAGGLPDTNAWPCLIKGMMRAGATPGSTLRIQMAAETAGGTMTVETGSFLKYRTV